MKVEQIISALSDLPIPQVQFHDVIGSTNDTALAWINSGAADGCLVVADQQTQGRGRLGRQWITRPGSALAFSLILHPTQSEQNHLSLFSPLGALAVSQSLEEKFGINPEIKWPNDVLLNRQKAAGILVETAWVSDQLEGLVIGIGLNVAAGSVPPASELMFPATSVEEAAGQPVDRVALLKAILSAMFSWRSHLASESFYQAWEKRLAFKGEWVRIEESKQTKDGQLLTGILTGLDHAGNLILKTPAAETIIVNVGDVHLRTID